MASDVSNPALFLPPIPGFDFLQSLVKKNTGVGLPGFGQWVAPTLNPEELERRIEELKTVQYWLEQNARMLGATIQALEVQRMTLSTLKTMNVQMTDLRDALMVRPGDAGGSAAAGATKQAATPPAPAAAPAQPKPRTKPAFPMPSMFGAAAKPEAAEAAPATPPQAAAAARPPSAPPAAAEQPTAAQPSAGHAGGAAPGSGADAPHPVDAMQWWAALTQQFADLASSALRDTAISAQKLAGASAAGGAAAQAGGSGPAAGADASGGAATPPAKAAARNGEPTP